VLLQFAGISLACLAFAGYWTRMKVLEEQGRPVPRSRFASFTAGLVVLLAALSPPLDSIADDVFAAHMAQHLLIGDLAALLLVIGLTGPMMQPILRLHWVDRLRPLANPIPALSLWALNFYAWHIPFMYQAAYDNELVHALQHVSFLFFGSLMWMPLFGPLPKPAWFSNFAKLGYIVAVRLLGTLLGNVFVWSGTVFYGFYGAGEAKHGLGALTDQSVAGAVMMIEQSILTICLFGWLFMRAAAEGEEKQELIEFAAAHGVELDDRRAGRAVSAGRGDELRRRIEARSPELEPAPTRGAAATAGSVRPES